jgi:hypothetical protein
MQRHIKENNKCTLVVELKFFVLFYSRRLSAASYKQIIAKREELCYITSNSKRADNYDYAECVR